MNMEAIRLVRVDFDCLENRNPEYETTEGIFVDEPERNRYIKVNDYLSTLTIKPYSGYNHQVYPQFKMIKIELR